MRTPAFRWAPRVGAAAGVALAVALLAGARLPEGDGRLGLDLTAAVMPGGELGTLSPGPLLAASDMAPGSGRVAGVAEVRNQTGRRLAFRLRALPSNRDVDDAVTIRVAGGERLLYEGALGGLRRWSRHELVLAAGEAQVISVAAWVDPRSGDRTAGRSVDVPLELRRES